MSDYKITATIDRKTINRLELLLEEHYLQMRGMHGVAGLIYSKLLNKALEDLLNNYDMQLDLIKEIHEETGKGDI